MVKESEFNSIVTYIRKQDNIPELATYEGYKASQKGKKKEKPVVSEEMKVAWSTFWGTWPSTKSVPNTQYKSGARMKSGEAKMMQKWLDAIEGKKTTVQKMQYAAECYLAWGYYDSIKNGRNELIYRNALDVWLNGEMYINYSDVEMPPVVKKQEKSSEANWAG